MPEYSQILKSSGGMEKPICDYLISECQKNVVFRNDVESSTGKSVCGMMKHITDEARKIAGGKSSVAVEDSTVFNWGFDYWHDKAEIEVNEKPKEKHKEKKQEKNEMQLRLFDI